METALRTLFLVILTGALNVARHDALAQTNPPAPPAAATPLSEPDFFFERYLVAERLVKQGDLQQAAFAMDLLAKTMSTSPWLEIALLKHSQLLENQNPKTALEEYTLLHHRVDNSPYFQGTKERAALFAVALRGATERGISRVRVYQVREGLGRYFVKYRQYPESLAKLAIFNFVDNETIHDYSGRPLRYVPTGQRVMPVISYLSYDLEPTVPEAFYVNTPQLEGTSLLSDNPPKYAGLIKVPGRADVLRIEEEQTLDGYFMAAIVQRGAIACSQDRLMVLPVR